MSQHAVLSYLIALSKSDGMEPMACLLLFTIIPIRYKMTGLTITIIQSSESLEMIETQTGRWNTQGQGRAG